MAAAVIAALCFRGTITVMKIYYTITVVKIFYCYFIELYIAVFLY